MAKSFREVLIETICRESLDIGSAQVLADGIIASMTLQGLRVIEIADPIEEMARDLALSIRGGVEIEDEKWDGPTDNDKELTAEMRKIAAYMRTLGYRRQGE